LDKNRKKELKKKIEATQFEEVEVSIFDSAVFATFTLL